jgi:hypothetical protein
MAYRFLLEVPTTLATDANAAVASAGDAQVLVDRNSHGLGFDDPYNNLTVAAQSLAVVDSLYQWATQIGATRPDSRVKVGIVLHSGQRLNLHDMDQPAVIAAIRRDQPWVERSVPKIGEHEPEYRHQVPASAPATTAPTGLLPAAPPIRAVDLIEADDELVVNGRSHAVIQVYDLPPAERLYAELFGLEITGRMRQDAEGIWQNLPATYDHLTAAQENTEADVAFMGRDPLHVALVRAGRAALLDYSRIHNDIAVAMDLEGTRRLKALVLMRGYTLLASAGQGFSFRDPFGVVWDVLPAR